MVQQGFALEVSWLLVWQEQMLISVEEIAK